MSAAGPRVVFLTNFLPPYRLPVLRTLARQLGGLRILVSTPMESNRSWAPEWEGLDVVVQRGVSIPRLWRHPSGFREWLPVHVPLDTRRQLAAYDPDLVLSAELGTRTAQAAWWCDRRQRPLVVWATLSERTELGRGHVRHWLRRQILARTAGVIVNGESGARYIQGLGFPDDRIHRVHQASPVGAAEPGPAKAGLPSRPVHPAPSGAAPLELLYVGLLVERKGLDPLVRDLAAWCDLRRRPVRLRLVGSGPLGESLQGLPTGAYLAVVADGAVPFTALESSYAAADLMVFPTLADEWGLVVNEAMACGLPVLGSVHSQAVTELVEEGTTGWRYDPERPGALAAAMDRVAAAGPGGLREMGRAARRRVAGLTPDAMADRLLHVIEDVIAFHRRRP